jgi:hypothetical protein
LVILVSLTHPLALINILHPLKSGTRAYDYSFVVFTALRVRRMAKEVDPSVCAQIKPELRKIYGMQGT